MSYGAQQNPDAYAKLVVLHKQTGVPPQVAQGNEAEVEHAAKVNSIDYPAMAVSHPRTSSWASNPDNAAVSHDDIGTLTNIESFGDRLKRNYKNETISFIPARTVKALVKTVTKRQQYATST
jgi:hypothetical protein